jgi:CheY-like chemotaxis protein
VVDDSTLIRRLVHMGFETLAGWDVVDAGSGLEAMERATADRPDVILLDVVMPGMDGPATFTALQTQDTTRDIPVIFVTARDKPADRVRFAALGAAGVIAKPFQVEALAGQVTDILDRHE